MTQAQAQGALVAALDTDTAGGAALDASDEVPGRTANVVIGLIFHDDLMAGFGIALLCKSFGIYREGGEIFRVCGVEVDGGQDDLCFVLVFDARIVQWANAIEREFLEHHLAGNSPPKAWAGVCIRGVLPLDGGDAPAQEEASDLFRPGGGIKREFHD